MAPQKGVTVASTDFPLYTIHMVGDSHILVAGGGGQSKTGVPNAMEIFGLTPADGSCVVTKVAFHHTPAGAAMNGCVSTNKKNNKIIALLGIDGTCYAYELRSRIITSKSDGNLADGVRKRKGNLTDSESHKSAAKTLSYDLDPIGSVQTDFSSEGGYQRVVNLTLDHTVMITGGADGNLRAWKFPDLSKLYEVKAHTDEIDDMHISPPGNRIITIGKDCKAFIWNTKDGSKNVELHWDIQKDAKYKFRGCRYGTVSDKQKYALYTTNIPLVRSTKPLPCYITKWDTSKYLPSKAVKTGTEILSSLAVRDDGVYLGVGTMSGSVSIYISFSLQKLYQLKAAHNIFVTGLQFASSTDTCQAITGNHDTTLFSISVDNQIKMHQVAARGNISALWVVLGGILCIYIFYWIMVSAGL